ncbi:hypothetical protein ACJMK2_005350 [Sinanodonta woodiana]|uniref:Uncharacterized protein n=1 Tax=Sinanodonta woodiana TaxID=1069815 RepID=A0ABD3VPR6_SINWO
MTGEVRYVTTQACEGYLELREGLTDSYGKRMFEQFTKLGRMKKESTETYRGLMARIDQHIKCFMEDRHHIVCLPEENKNKNNVEMLPHNQVQWIRSNKGSSPV